MKYKRFIRWTVLVLLLLLVIFLFIGFVWWKLPYTQIDLTQLSNPSTLVQIDIPTPSGTLTREIFIHQIETRYLSQIPDGFKLKLTKKGLSIFYPQETRVTMFTNPFTEVSIYTIGINLGRSIKLINRSKNRIESQLFEGASVSKSIINGYSFIQRSVPAKSDKAMNAMVWIDSGFYASTDIEYLQKLAKQYNPRKISKSKFPDIINLSVNNKSSFLTDKIKAYEEQYQIDIFPSIGQVASMEIKLIPKDYNTVNGTVIFHVGEELSEDDSLVSDINFCYGSIRRALRPMNIELKGEQSISGQDAKFTFELSGVESAISQLEKFIKEKGN